jgi:hypothetical protein
LSRPPIATVPERGRAAKAAGPGAAADDARDTLPSKEAATYACIACGATDAITLALDGRADVVCPACRRPQPARHYEMQRICDDFARAIEPARPQPPVETAADVPTVCPSCGEDLYTVEYGCAAARAGTPSPTREA